jgi:hypothetical protein
LQRQPGFSKYHELVILVNINLLCANLSPDILFDHSRDPPRRSNSNHHVGAAQLSLFHALVHAHQRAE